MLGEVQSGPRDILLGFEGSLPRAGAFDASCGIVGLRLCTAISVISIILLIARSRLAQVPVFTSLPIIYSS